MPRPEPRYHVNFTVRVSWQAQNNLVRQISGKCTDLSASGARVETLDPLDVRGLVLLSSECFGRMGHASVRYCRREGMKYAVGLQFNVQFGLSDPSRKKMLEKVVLSSISEAPTDQKI
jgi:hypothetical protein